MKVFLVHTEVLILSFPVHAGKSATEILKQICSLVSQTPLGEVLGSVPDGEQLQLYDCYLHDYVKSVHKCYHKNEEVSMQEYNVCAELCMVQLH